MNTGKISGDTLNVTTMNRYESDLGCLSICSI